MRGRGKPGWSPGTVLAAIALLILVGGGSAYAGSKLGKNAVKSRNIAPDAVTNKQTRNLAVPSPRNVKAHQGFENSAPKVILAKRGPFTVYARCWQAVPNGITDSRLTFDAAKSGAVGRVGTTTYQGDAAFIPKGASNIAFQGAANNHAASLTGSALAIRDKVSTQVSISAFIKAGTTSAGNGTYGAGARCIYLTTETGTG